MHRSDEGEGPTDLKLQIARTSITNTRYWQMSTVISLELPSAAYEQLRLAATRQNRPVADVVKDIVLREIPDLPTLPADVEAELESFWSLSDDVLWLIARSSLPRQ